MPSVFRQLSRLFLASSKTTCCVHYAFGTCCLLGVLFAYGAGFNSRSQQTPNTDTIPEMNLFPDFTTEYASESLFMRADSLGADEVEPNWRSLTETLTLADVKTHLGFPMEQSLPGLEICDEVWIYVKEFNRRELQHGHYCLFGKVAGTRCFLIACERENKPTFLYGKVLLKATEGNNSHPTQVVEFFPQRTS